MNHKYYILNKPFNMVSQFISPDAVNLLGKIDFPFPEGTHAIGRLDNDSEGLLILTTNKKVTKLLFESKIPHERTYLVQVRGLVTNESIALLRSGIPIFIKGSVFYTTAACKVESVQKPFNLFEAKKKKNNPYFDQLPSSWLSITLKEGKFHQVRKMVRAAGHPCIRLIRTSIENLILGDLQPGEVKTIEEKDFFQLLKIDGWQN